MIKELVAFSNKYGSNEELVLAGGGNTSAKDGRYMYVKASGTALATITEQCFVKIDLDALSVIYTKDYPQDDAQREALVLADLMASRAPGEQDKRPSVETTLHALFPQTYVLHLHPALVNGVTCGVGAQAAARRAIADDFIWVDACKPGYILAKLCCDKMKEYEASHGKSADMIILQNHGIFIAADSVAGLDSLLTSVMSQLKAALVRQPDMSESDPSQALSQAERELSQFGKTVAVTCGEALRVCADRQAATAVMMPFTPDHIVYCKAYPLFIGSGESIDRGMRDYKSKNGFSARIVLIESEGALAVGDNYKQAATAAKLFEDSLRIAAYCESFGGALHMSAELTDFIVNWEVESYRSSQSK